MIEKLLCNFVEDRTAAIKIENIIGPKFALTSGVPQGSILSPPLFIYNNAKMTRPAANCVDVGFTDDNTQIITYPLRSKEMLSTITSEEITRVNAYEKKWKIKTNKTKFQLLSISATKPHNVLVDRVQIPFKNKITVLGLDISTRGITSHLNRRLVMAKKQYMKLKWFKKMSTKIQLQLYRTLIRPIMEYPIIPLCIASKTNKRKIQQFQNRVLRTATQRNQEDNDLNISDLHAKYKIEAINSRFYRLASRVWDRLTETNEDLVQQSEAEDKNDLIQDHYWWRRISPYIRRGEPPPDFA